MHMKAQYFCSDKITGAVHYSALLFSYSSWLGEAFQDKSITVHFLEITCMRT